jgi:hypothetical protein
MAKDSDRNDCEERVFVFVRGVVLFLPFSLEVGVAICFVLFWQ